jgi:hypothetical protein
MKKYMWVCFLMIFMLAIVVPGNLFSQEEEEEEEGEPVQAYPNPMAWKQLETMGMLRTLKMVQKGDAWEFDLKNIKLALEKARINQNVTIQYVNTKGMAYSLGTFSPVKKEIQKRKSKMHTDKINQKLINPQPEPPRLKTSLFFPPIPSQVRIPNKYAKKTQDVRWKNKAVLIFKDAAGQTKAVVELSMGPIPKATINKSRKKTHF